MTQVVRLFVRSCLIFATVSSASAQISFTTAVDLALRSNPKVLSAQADVDRARAQLSETRDVYIPSLVANSGLGYSYGFPLGQPTVFSLTSQSLLFNFSQHDYIRAARAGLEAANFALKDARQQVEEDVALTYVSLDQAQQRKTVAAEEYSSASRLVSIVQDRLDAGQDNAMELLRARRTTAEIRLLQIQIDNEVSSFADHLARIVGLSDNQFTTVSSSIPPIATPAPSSNFLPESPALLAAKANAASKLEQARGDMRYLLRPQVAFVAQYSRFSNFNNYTEFYPTFNNFNAAAVGVQMSLPVFDRVHQDKARESLGDAHHAAQDAITARNQFLEGRLKLSHSTTELQARAELASIERDIAHGELDIILLQLQSSTSGTEPQITPKDEQKARIQERQKFIDLIQADFQLHQTQIYLLRQNGQLEDWLKSVAQSQGQTQLNVSPVTH